MAGSDDPAAALGVTDPTKWSAASWVSDVVGHLTYGLVTAAVYDSFAAQDAWSTMEDFFCGRAWSLSTR